MPIRRTIKLLLDKAAARKVERDLKAQSRRIESEQKRTWKRIGQFVVGAFGVRALARFTAEMFRLGSAASETASKFNTVFGPEAAAELDVFLDKFGKLAGLTQTEGRDMLAIAGAIGQGVGLAGDDVAAFSQQIVELAADLQSFHDVPIAETFAAIRSGATGEAEQLKRFGIILRAAEVDQLALAMSNKTVAKELTEVERVTARMLLITEKAGKANGDLARTQDSTANTARQLAQVWRQLKEDIAGGLLPVFSLVINAWADISGGAQGAADVIGGFSAALVKWVAGIQFLAVQMNALFRSIPARVQMMSVKVNEFIIKGLLRPMETAVNKLRELFRLDPVDITSTFAAANEALRTQAAIDLAAWRALVEQEKDAILKAAKVIDEATGGGPTPPPDPAEDPATIAARKAADERAQIRREESAVAQQEFEAQERLSAEIIASSAEAKTNAEKALEEMQAKATRTAGGMTSAFQTFFAATASGFSGTTSVWAAAGQAARDASAAIVEGMISGRAETEIALGTAAIASGTWPPNPAAIAAGFKHFAAAALFKAIPGAISGGGGGGSGAAGAGGSPLPQGALGTSAPGVDEPLGTEINIFIDSLSPADPDFQRVVLGAIQNATERFGENVKVNVHPRSGRL